eukprot:TRINITY_DN14509_c0_g1_i1.p1 TRINITY_DN14509_c0_g1~~TRINITY_DN14509_c0_g1_i1.p1  ORF type:complete len:357 (-),score=55.92 TRINITY_DN14509_c0_g1_i1:98-1168(-)
MRRRAAFLRLLVGGGRILARRSYSAPSQVPVLSVKAFVENDGTDEMKQAVGKEVYDACTKYGFFLVKDYEKIVSREKMKTAFDNVNRVFDLPYEEKISMPKNKNHGYVKYGEENLSTIYPEHNNKIDIKLGDFKEAFDWGVDVYEGDEDYGKPFRVPNFWPDPNKVGARFKPDVLEYFDSMIDLGRVIMRMCAISLSLPEMYFAPMIAKPMPTLRFIRYPPQSDDQISAEEARIGCGAHSDYGSCTILAQDGTPGLELLLKDSTEWIPVPSIPNTLIINVGDMLQRWTNDVYVSTLHRVKSYGNPNRRHSIAFFFEPDYDTNVECIPTCLKPGEKPKYPPVKFGEHLDKMYAATYG